jgi:hypothetical protein
MRWPGDGIPFVDMSLPTLGKTGGNEANRGKVVEWPRCTFLFVLIRFGSFSNCKEGLSTWLGKPFPSLSNSCSWMRREGAFAFQTQKTRDPRITGQLYARHQGVFGRGSSPAAG